MNSEQEYIYAIFRLSSKLSLKNGPAHPPPQPKSDFFRRLGPPEDLTTQTGYMTTPVGCRGGCRYVEGCWGFPLLKIKMFLGFCFLVSRFYGSSSMRAIPKRHRNWSALVKVVADGDNYTGLTPKPTFRQTLEEGCRPQAKVLVLLPLRRCFQPFCFLSISSFVF